MMPTTVPRLPAVPSGGATDTSRRADRTRPDGPTAGRDSRLQARQAFENALRQAERGDDAGDAKTAEPTTPWHAAASVTAPLNGFTARAVGSAAAGVDMQTTNLASQRQALMARMAPVSSSADTGACGQWQLELLDRSLPVQRLDLQRTDNGRLHLALGAGFDPSRKAPLDKLRERLAARGCEPISLRYLGSDAERGADGSST